MLETYPILSLLPPLVAIILVIVTKKVLLSLGLGILSAALLIENFSPLGTLQKLWYTFSAIFWDYEGGTLNSYNLLVLCFLICLGIITSMVMMSGGTYAFANWMRTKIKNRRGAQIASAALGMAIFIDDYFNALAVGQVARPITDEHRVSRAKLAYLVDSTSAPVAVLMPFSSWGASIIGIIAPILAASTLSITDAGAFLVAASMNYYAIVALVLIWLVVLLKIDFGPMRKEEARAVETGQLYAQDEVIPGQLSDNLPQHTPGAIRALLVPFGLLIFGVFLGIAHTGYQNSGSWSLVDILANTDVPLALNYGGILGLLAALFYYFRYTRNNQAFTSRHFGLGVLSGTGSMMPAVYILVMAWMLGSLISELGTGEYIGTLVAEANISAHWLIPVMFLVAGAMAFSTGTSWGSFGILLPLAGEILLAAPDGESVLLAAFGAVLAGAVLGDHCSPISDTTILSSTGAGSNLITHVNTQLPYALTGAVAALLGYVALALTTNGWIGLVVSLIAIIAISLGLRAKNPPHELA